MIKSILSAPHNINDMACRPLDKVMSQFQPHEEIYNSHCQILDFQNIGLFNKYFQRLRVGYDLIINEITPASTF